MAAAWVLRRPWVVKTSALTPAVMTAFATPYAVATVRSRA